MNCMKRTYNKYLEKPAEKPMSKKKLRKTAAILATAAVVNAISGEYHLEGIKRNRRSDDSQ